MGKRRYFAELVLVLCLVLFGGCGSQNRESSVQENAEAGQTGYLVQETVIPDPDEALKDMMESGDKIRELEYCMQGEKVYRLVELHGERELSGKVYDDYPYGWYMQILESPYQEWKTYEITSQYWNLEIPYRNYYMTKGLQLGADGTVYCIVDGPNEDASLWVKYLGRWNREGEGELLGQMEDLSGNPRWCIAKDRIYTFNLMSSQITEWNEQMEVKQTFSVDGQVWGMLYYPEDEQIYWYGMRDEAFGIYAVEGRKKLLTDCEDVGSFVPDMVYTALAPSGELYFSDRSDLRHITKNGAEILCNYRELNYPLSELRGMSVLEDDSVLLAVEMTDGAYLLKLTKGEVTDKQEIVLAATVRSSVLIDAVRCFNRQDSKYYVTIREPEEEEVWEEYKRRMQIEVSAGGGADLFYDEAINVEGFAENGYLADLGYLLEDVGAEIFEPALEAGVIDGVQYGIPYMWRMMGTAFDKRIAGERSAWTLSEFMESVRNSDVEMVQAGYDGTEIVLWYGLYDRENKELIDWEAGKSHLTEAPFLELLEFAKEYGDIDENREEIEYGNEERGELFKQGKVAGEWIDILCPADVNYAEAIFRGEASFVGFPRVEGRGNYAYVFPVYMNANTKRREGAEEFIRFLLSDEMQRYNVRQGDELPVRRELLEYGIECSRDAADEEMLCVRNGISYNRTEFTEAEEKQFRFVIESVRPFRSYSAIDDMVYEELAPFFEGQKSAEQVAEILDKRVQLYLDER